MRPGQFILDGQMSSTYGVVIQDRPLIETPRRKVDHISSYGKSGTDPFDEEAYENTDMDLILYSEGNKDRPASENRDRIYEWFDSGMYMDFIPYFDQRKIYKVMTVTPPSFSPKYYHEEGQPFEVGLTVMPYKYYVKNELYSLSAPGSVYNTSIRTALPIIKIFGMGDVTLNVNGHDFVIQNIVGDIILECKLGIAYRENSGVIISNDNSKIFTRKYPFLKRGNNTISWTGNVSKVEIDPRWRTLA